MMHGMGFHGSGPILENQTKGGGQALRRTIGQATLQSHIFKGVIVTPSKSSRLNSFGIQLNKRGNC